MSEITTTTGNLVTDASGKPAPQYVKTDGSGFAMVQGKNGAILTQNTDSPLGAAVTLQNAATTTGAGTALSTNGAGVAVLAVSTSTLPAWSGTITFQGQGPDNNWYNVSGRLRATGIASTTTTNGGLFEINARGLQAVRANISAYTAGSVTVVGVTQALPSTADSVQLAGNMPPLTAIAPRLAGVVTSSQITSAGNSYFRFSNLLTRNARARTFLIYNNGLGMNASGVHIYPYDSAMNPLPSMGNGIGYADFGTIGNNSWAIQTSEFGGSNAALLAAHVDSFDIILNLASRPTSGSLQIYAVEMI